MIKNVDDVKNALLNKVLKNFWEKVSKTENCWVWKGCIKSNGYGGMTILRKDMPAHRFSWMIHKGDIPERYWVLHKCDNKICVNPDHLFIGDVRDNVSDLVNKGLHVRGERQGHHKLTEEKVKEIRKTYIPRKTSMQSMAKQYGVTVTVIFQVIHRITWKHI